MKRSLVLVAMVVSAAFLISGRLATTSAVDDDKKPRVFEIRTYSTDSEEMAKAMHERFRNHTCELFKKHGMDLIGFWVPQDDKTKLIYILAFPSRDAAKASWKAFSDDPQWKKVYADSHEKAGGPIVKKVESVYMDPADYSAIK